MNDGATTYHKETVLRYLLHHLGPPLRAELMREHPVAYNDVVCDGREVTRVVYGPGCYIEEGKPI